MPQDEQEGKVALISGCSGQDGSYLADLLIEKGYEVHGVIRRSSSPNLSRIEHIRDKIILHEGDLTDQGSLTEIIKSVKPQEVYNLAAQSFVPTSWTQPIQTADVTGIGVLRFLEAIRSTDPTIRFFQASSSEMFGKVRETPQNELTPFYPRSPYGVAKTFAFYMTVNYRESYGMYACSGISFNHESPRRGLEFVTRKITNAAANKRPVRLGNLDAKRDWGYAPDYVEAYWLMLQQEKPEDFVIATGIMHSVRDVCRVAYEHVGLNWEDYVTVDPAFLRPAEVDQLQGDSRKALEKLHWKPKTTFGDMIKLMVDSEQVK